MKRKALLLLPVTAMCLTGCSGVHYDIDKYILSVDKTKDSFTILQLTDFHLGEMDNLEYHEKFMDLTIDEAQADMIVVTGDLFTFASKWTAINLFKYLDSKKIPWTVTFGNHDEQCYFSIDWLTDTLNNWGSYCKFIDYQDDDVHGNANFAINVMDGENIFEQLIIMDSNRYDFATFGYDCFKQDQIDWYASLVDYTTQKNGGSPVESLMFYHIPLPEIDAAYEKGTKIIVKDEKGEDVEMGSKGEKTCPPDSDPGFFKVIKEKNSTKAMFFGHDHDNDFGVTYEGVDFIYGTKSTNLVYYTESKLGGLKITIDANHTRHYEMIHHTYAELEGK